MLSNKKIPVSYLRLCSAFAAVSVLSSQVALADDAPEKIKVGDEWTYLETNDITGTPNGQLLMTVNEISDKEFTVRVSIPNNNNSYLLIFDNDWNAKQQGQVKFTPNDGRGAPHDAKVGSTWDTKYVWQDLSKGAGGKGESKGKCIANEQIANEAGTFDTLKCEVVITTKPPGGGAATTETTITTWFAPKTLRWAKRQFVTKERGHLSESRTQELVSYDLKP